MEFKTGVIRPVECFQEGWELIKDRYWLFFLITLVGILIASFVPLGIVMGAMFCGIYYCLFKHINREPVEFSHLFKGFDYFLPSLIVTLFVAVPSLIFGVGVQVTMSVMQLMIRDQIRSPQDAQAFLFTFLAVFGGSALIFGLIVSCIHALIMFAYPLIVEHKLSGMEAFKTSARAVWKNLGGVIGIIAIEIILSFIGLLLCYVGAFLVMPLNFAAVIVAYRKVFPHSFGQQFDTPPPPPQFVNQSQWQ